ncbi:MAG: CAP domain-containing protein [Halorientalis sp.]
MANNTALGVLGVIVLVAIGVGILVGMQLGGPVPGNETGTPTGGGTPTPFPTAGPGVGGTVSLPEGQTTIPARQFDAAAIEAEIAQLINQERREQGLDPLVRTGQLSQRISDMARRHSVAMANAGLVRHRIDGVGSSDRYRRANLYDTCQFLNDAGSYIIRPNYPRPANLEVIATSVVGQPYVENGQRQFNEDAEAVARDIVTAWRTDPDSWERLAYANARNLGVGVEITDSGRVYATANVC